LARQLLDQGIGLKPVIQRLIVLLRIDDAPGANPRHHEQKDDDKAKSQAKPGADFEIAHRRVSMWPEPDRDTSAEARQGNDEPLTAGLRNFLWCSQPESNRHDRSRGVLSPLRLPIPPWEPPVGRLGAD